MTERTSYKVNIGELKRILESVPDPEKPYILLTDKQNIYLGAVLSRQTEAFLLEDQQADEVCHCLIDDCFLRLSHWKFILFLNKSDADKIKEALGDSVVLNDLFTRFPKDGELLHSNDFMKISEVFTDYVNDKITASKREMNQNNLDRFHIVGKDGKPTGAFDFEICEDIKRKEDLFVMGKTIFIYENGLFSPDDSGSRIKSMIKSRLYPQFKKNRTITAIYDLLVSDYELETDFEHINQYPAHWINFQNGFYDPKKKEFVPHDPKYKCINQIPHEYHKEEKPDGAVVEDWLKFCVSDNDDRKMLFQYAGYSMTRDVSQQKFLFLNGEGGTGKSTLIEMFEEMVGYKNISNISLSELGTRFASYGLMGKLLNSCADLEITALEDVSVLKKVLGEDTLRVEQKGKDAFSMKNYAKLIFSTNELPIVKNERTNGFYRRIIALTFNRTPDKINPDLPKQLKEQIDYFIHLAVDGVEEMYKEKNIFISPNSKKVVEQMKRNSDTVEAWIFDEMVKRPDHWIERSKLYNSYKSYCEENERIPLKQNGFYTALRTKRFEETKRGVEGFKGLCFSDESCFEPTNKQFPSK